jgi:hypothetical protein
MSSSPASVSCEASASIRPMPGRPWHDKAADALHRAPRKPSRPIVTLMCMNSLRRPFVGAHGQEAEDAQRQADPGGNQRGGMQTAGAQKSQPAPKQPEAPQKPVSPLPCETSILVLASIPVAHYRWMRADPPLAKARTCSTVAMVVSPGKVVSNAPCAHPSLTASSGVSPVSRP